MSFRRILLAVDDSPSAAHAADVAIELARSLGSEIALIHAIDPTLGYAPGSGVPPADLLKLAEQEGKRLLAEFRARVTLGRPALEFAPLGTPADAIVSAAGQWPADLIVLGSHGRGGLSRLMLGSVAEAVMRHAPCPVLVVRARS
jgi:nucleotide-binding universal stress UspA family protein